MTKSLRAAPPKLRTGTKPEKRDNFFHAQLHRPKLTPVFFRRLATALGQGVSIVSRAAPHLCKRPCARWGRSGRRRAAHWPELPNSRPGAAARLRHSRLQTVRNLAMATFMQVA